MSTATIEIDLDLVTAAAVVPSPVTANISVESPNMDIGIPGPTGPPGPASTVPGPEGPPGATGAQGPQGPQGIPGTAGATGSQGPKGDKGDTGATGSQGPQGNTGAQGTAGTPGEKWFSGTGAPAGGTGIVGDWYLNDANGDVYEKTGASTWTLRDNLTGPQGIQGIQGPTGNTGSQGPTGNTGSQGPQGNTGPAGPPLFTRNFLTAHYYRPPNVVTTSWAGLSVNTASVIPFICYSTGKFDRIGIQVITALASAVFRMGIYADSGCLPGALLVDAGTIDASTTGVKELTINVTCAANTIYWLAGAMQGAVAQVDLCSGTANAEFMIGATVGSSGGPHYPGYNFTAAGALPASLGITAATVPQIRAFSPFVRWSP